MKKVVCAVMLASLSLVALADSYDDNLKKYGLTRINRMSELAEFTGNRVFQFQGTVQGVCTSETGCMFSVQTPEGFALQVSTPSELPDWMLGTNVTAKFILRVEKLDESASPQATLISAKQCDLVLSEPAPKITAPKKPTPASPQPAKRDRRQPEPMKGSIGLSRGGSPTRKPTTTPRGNDWALPQSEATPYYRDFILSQNRRIGTDVAEQIAAAIVGFSIQYDVDARLVTALVMSESNFNPRDVSHVGAAGLGQLMPETARELGVTDRFSTNENVSATIRLLKSHMDKYTRQTGSEAEGLRRALAAYNAGPGAVSRAGGVPPYRETQNYVRKVVRIYKQLAGLD